MPVPTSRRAGLCATRTRLGTHRRAARSSAAARNPSRPLRGWGKAGKCPIGGTDASTTGTAPTRRRRSTISSIRSCVHRPGPWTRSTSLTPSASTIMSTGVEIPGVVGAAKEHHTRHKKQADLQVRLYVAGRNPISPPIQRVDQMRSHLLLTFHFPLFTFYFLLASKLPRWFVYAGGGVAEQLVVFRRFRWHALLLGNLQAG
jgi:hypothetical protein